MNVFDFLNSINYTKKNILEEDILLEKQYVPFIVNKYLSYFPDTLMHSNQMNKLSFISKKDQYEYFINAIRKRKRYSKWKKKEDNLQKEISLKNIMEYFECSYKRAEEYLNILNNHQIQAINAIYASKMGLK
jgi:hypothetical protein